MNDTTELPDAIRLPLHRLWADAGYLIGRARQETDPERFVTIIKSRCEEIEAAYRADRAERAAPVDMMLYCPNCGRQHVDAPEQGALISGGPNAGRARAGWSNPPHRSHLCHSCGTIWRPADVPTNGVAAITTTGKADTWAGKAPFAAPAIPSSGAEGSKP